MQTQQENIEAMRNEVETLGGTITTYEEVPLDIEEQLLRRALRRPEYMERERSERGLSE